MLDSNKVSIGLIRAGFRQTGATTKLLQFERASQTVYVKVRGTDRPLVIHGKYGSHLSALLSISGVSRTKPSSTPYHNSNMRSFDERLNSGQRMTRYGYDFGFSDSAALANFLDAL